jgi:uncharacterized protein YjbI with pentapeptide repeats
MANEPRPRIPISADWVLMMIREGKNVRLKNAAIHGDLDINKLDLPTKHIERTEVQKRMGLAEDVKVVQSWINITNSTFEGNLNLRNSYFSGPAWFNGATFSEYAEFDGATFSWPAGFNGATFSGLAKFYEATFNEYAGFEKATFSWPAGFYGATFSEYAEFEKAIFGGFAVFEKATFRRYAGFEKATFGGPAWFNGATFSGDALFKEATFNEDVEFGGAKFEGDVSTFRNATFFFPRSMEEACRKAKNALAKAGNREEEEYHFYREMEAKQILKGIRGNSGLGLGSCLKTDTWTLWKFFYSDVLEWLFVQKIFGYGVHPRRVILSWFLIVVLFTLVYWIIDGMKGGLLGTLDYFESSFATAIAPGYIAAIINGARYTPLYHVSAIFETIIGTFLWAGFIATFAKRYMK